MIARAALALAICAPAAAHADGSDAAPDPRAVLAGQDANLESNAPRTGVVLAAAIGGGLVLGEGGVGRGPSASFRVGHVATRDTVITFELTGGSRLHRDAVSGNTPLYHDDDYNLMAGALTYVLPSLWLRGAAGLSALADETAMGTAHHVGGAGLFGIGIDLVKLRSFAIDLESWGMVSLVTQQGAVFDSGLCVGFTYY